MCRNLSEFVEKMFEIYFESNGIPKEIWKGSVVGKMTSANISSKIYETDYLGPKRD